MLNEQQKEEMIDYLYSFDCISSVIGVCESYGIDINSVLEEKWFTIDQMLDHWKSYLLDDEWMSLVYDIQSASNLSYNTEWVHFRNEDQSTGYPDNSTEGVNALVKDIVSSGKLDGSIVRPL